jgi:hypothetical protein
MRQIFAKASLDECLERLMADYQIIGPKAKGPKFAFGPITDPAQLRLDYDTTVAKLAEMGVSGVD